MADKWKFTPQRRLPTSWQRSTRKPSGLHTMSSSRHDINARGSTNARGGVPGHAVERPSMHLILKMDTGNPEPVAISLNQFAEEITPSNFAKANGDGGWVVKLKGRHDQVYCYRELRHEPLPLSLLHPVFGCFQDDCQNVPIAKDDWNFVIQLCGTLYRSFSTDAELTAAAVRLLSEYFGIHVGSSSHASVLHPNGRLCFDLVCKLERGGSGGDPMMQNVGYYLKHFPQHADGRLPCILMDLCGSFMALFGICNTSNTHAVCEPLAPGFPLLHVSNELLMTYHVCSWVALKKAVRALASAEEATAGGELGLRRIQVPYKVKFTTQSGEEVRLTYYRHVTRHVFEAAHNLTNVLVKFAKRYSETVHKYCHDLNFAPKLLHHERIAGGWIVLVMERVEGLEEVWSQSARHAAKSQLEELATALAANGYVHGDLRGSNVMWDPARSRIVVLDFDWAGVEGHVVFPPFLNPEIAWPVGASTGRPILGPTIASSSRNCSSGVVIGLVSE